MIDLRKKQSEKSMALILATATRHFAEKGLTGARVDAIADDAGVNKALLYYHFKDKETLYSRVLLDVVSRTVEAISSSVEQAALPEEKLRAYIFSLIHSVSANPYFASMLMREVASGGATIPKEATQYMGRIIKLVSGILEEGRQLNRLKPIDPILLHTHLIGGISFFIASAPLRKRVVEAGIDPKAVLPVPVDQAAEDIAETIINGLRV